jgi:precorrin-2 dehydrogenase / sirohydrochlorin ferrochelatase
MTYYPIHLDVRDRPCLVVGGGGVGTRKVSGLLGCGARVTLVSPEITDTLTELARAGRITLHRRAFQESDIDGAFLVMGATDDEDLNRRIHAAAEARGVLCNIADRPEICHFILPAVIRRGDLTVTVSTSGRSPALAKALRRELEGQFGPEYAEMLRLMGAIRARLLAEAHAPEAHKPLFEALIAGDLLGLIRAEDLDGIDALMAEVLGPGFRYRELIAEAPPCS